MFLILCSLWQETWRCFQIPRSCHENFFQVLTYKSARIIKAQWHIVRPTVQEYIYLICDSPDEMIFCFALIRYRVCMVLEMNRNFMRLRVCWYWYVYSTTVRCAYKVNIIRLFLVIISFIMIVCFTRCMFNSVQMWPVRVSSSRDYDFIVNLLINVRYLFKIVCYIAFQKDKSVIKWCIQPSTLFFNTNRVEKRKRRLKNTCKLFKCLGKLEIVARKGAKLAFHKKLERIRCYFSILSFKT